MKEVLTPILLEWVDEVAKVARGAYHEWGTLRGYMDQITIGDSVSRFRITHSLTGAKISCTFGPELFEKVKAALPARVEIYGRLKRNRSDNPTHIEIETFRTLPDQFAPLNTVPAIDITSGVDSADFVERLRDVS